MKNVISNNGVPLAVYADRHTIFRSPKTDKLSLEDELNGKKVNATQFGRAMAELSTNLIWAKSAQAKGRIERLWETLQSWLPVELNIAGISTTEEANTFLAMFINRYKRSLLLNPGILSPLTASLRVILTSTTSYASKKPDRLITVLRFRTEVFITGLFITVK